MRFLADGPNIPDQLLEARDNGNVVFLCGAGVSIPAGMPDFASLTERVIDYLGAPEDGRISKDFAPWKKTPSPEMDGSCVPITARTPLDHIFNSLQAEYGPVQVNNAVAEILSQPAKSQVWKTHDTIARLSRGTDGVPQIVTTNFDLLFENVGSIKHVKDPRMVFEPPTFPDLLHGKGVSGLTYLHGRLRTDDTRQHDYILSSADFGRAYLAEGWATTFVRRLLEMYTVVLLGYQADDPPMRYLLQGLNRTAKGASRNLYAFDEGTSDEVELKWRDRGVTPIPYSKDGKDHPRLWKSLEAWAERADDPEAWRSGIIESARKGPRSLSDCERGQVAHVVRSNQGATAFANAGPSIPPEWICVFDRERRLDDKVTDPDTKESFDARANYALDDDPPEQSGVAKFHELAGDDLIAWRPGDRRLVSPFRLANTPAESWDELPERLHHLCSWLAANCGDPIVAWWAAKQRRLHPLLAAEISRQIEHRSDVPEPARKAWNLIFEDFESSKFHHPNIKWRTALRRVARDGWTPSTIREVERLTEPVVRIGTLGEADLLKVKPPLEPWSDVTLHDIANFKVEFPDQNEKPLSVPDDYVCAVFSLASRNLVKGLERLADVEEMRPGRFGNVTLYEDTAQSGRQMPTPVQRHVLWVAELMDRAAEVDPVRMAATVALWPSGEFRFLNKLRLFAWNKANAYPGDEVATNLCNLDQSGFWDYFDEREFLFLLRDRWKDISKSNQAMILQRILDGPSPTRDEKPAAGDERNATVLTRLRWLERNGCVLSSEVSERASQIQESLPDWDESRVNVAARSHVSRVISIRLSTDPSIFDGVEDSEIVKIARQHTGRRDREFTDHRPFDGLVQSDPDRALSGLEFAAGSDDFPETLWTALVQGWPCNAPLPATKRLSSWIQKLPDKLIKANASMISAWMDGNLPIIAAKDEALALEAFDAFLPKLECVSREEASPDYVQVTASSNGRLVEPSQRTSHFAIAGSYGLMAKTLMSMLATQDHHQGHGMPDEFSSRLNRLLEAEETRSDQAICVLAQQLVWLHGIAPDWARAKLVPCFSLDHPKAEPAWSGILNGNWNSVTPDLYEAIKAPFLELFPKMYEWRWVDGMEFKSAHEWLVLSAIQHVDDARYTSPTEARAAIRNASENGRVDMIRFLVEVGEYMQNGWSERVVPFLHDIWPKEQKLQTEETSVAFLAMMSRSGKFFPNVFQAAREFLRPTNLAYLPLYDFFDANGDGEEPIARLFPREVLNMVNCIVPNDPKEAALGLREILAMISEKSPSLQATPEFVRLRRLLEQH